MEGRKSELPIPDVPETLVEEEATPELRERVRRLIEEHRLEDFEALERWKAKYPRGGLASTDLTDTAVRTLGHNLRRQAKEL